MIESVRLSLGVLMALTVLTGQPASAQGNAPVRITASMKGVSLAQALREIQRKSGTKILFVV